MQKLFLIIGAPGSGKTTDAQLIAKNHDNITHYSTGDMFRAEVASGSERGKILDSYMSAGNIVPIELAIKTIINAIIPANLMSLFLLSFIYSTTSLIFYTS
jgi:adenylate kinase